MRVDVEGGADLRVAQAMLDDFRTNSCGNQRSRIAVAKIVQTNLGKLDLFHKTLPLLCDGVGMEGLTILSAQHIA